MYTLGHNYGGEARSPVKQFGRPKNYGRDRGQIKFNYKDNYRPRRISPKWMRGVKGFFVCGKYHRANYLHTRAEVTAEVKRLKSKHPLELLAGEDHDFVTSMISSGNEEP